jgi:hypothetical protein
VWFCTPVFPTLRRLRQEDVKFGLHNKTLSQIKTNPSREKEHMAAVQREEFTFIIIFTYIHIMFFRHVHPHTHSSHPPSSHWSLLKPFIFMSYFFRSRFHRGEEM